MSRLFLIIILLSLCTAALAQNEVADHQRRRPYYGYVIAADSREPIRNTHVISKMAHCGTITNLEGKFVIPAKGIDTLWVSCIGYSRRLIAIDSTMSANYDTLLIALSSDTITLREVTIMPFYDYETFKKMFLAMPSIKAPRDVQLIEEELSDLWLSNTPSGNGTPTITASPIQFLHDKYSQSVKRQAKLLRNRCMYNEVLREQGRTDELLPDSLDYPINYSVYELDEAAETNIKKPLIPLNKYVREGKTTHSYEPSKLAR